MTVEVTTNRVNYTGNGATTDFDFPFKYFNATDLQVYVDGALVNGDDYTITANASGEGGTVAFDTAPAVDAVILILRALAYTQGSKVPIVDKLGRGLLENMVDKNTLLVQQVQEATERSVALPTTYVGNFDPTLPETLTPGRTIKVNDAGTGFELSGSDVDEVEAATAASAAAASASAVASASSAAASAVSAASSAASAVASQNSADEAAASALTAATFYRNFADDGFGPVTAPTVAEDRGIAIGDGAVVEIGATGSYAIGADAAVREGASGSFAMGELSEVGIDASDSVVIGSSAFVTQDAFSSIAIGIVARCFIDKAVAIGDTATARATGSVCVGEEATVGTLADNSLALGSFSDVGDSAESCVALGHFASTAASAIRSCAIGYEAIASDPSAVALGHGADASAERSMALNNATANAYGSLAVSPSFAPAVGDYQFEVHFHQRTTTDAVLTEMTLADAATYLTIAAGRVYAFETTIIGTVTAGGTSGNTIVMRRAGVIKNVAGTTAVVGAIDALGSDKYDAALATATCDVDADNTNDRLALKVQGIAATTIRWAAVTRMTHLRYV